METFETSNVEKLQTYLNACRAVQKQAAEGTIVKKSSGICDAIFKQVNTKIDNAGRDVFLFMAHYAKSWEYFSGHSRFPIPSTDKFRDEIATYMHTKNLWEGEQLRLRQALLKHIIIKLIKEIKLCKLQQI